MPPPLYVELVGGGEKYYLRPEKVYNIHLVDWVFKLSTFTCLSSLFT